MKDKKNIPSVGTRIMIALLMLPFILWLVPTIQQNFGLGGTIVAMVIIFGIMAAAKRLENKS